MTSNDFGQFSTNLPTTSDNFLFYNIQFFVVTLDPHTYSKIGRHQWTFPFGIFNVLVMHTDKDILDDSY